MLRNVGFMMAVAAMLLLAAPVGAGSWVVITLDSLPRDIRAGEPLAIGFMVRQHGQTPTNGVSPTLYARNRTTGESIAVEAQQSGETGHFVAEVVFPSDGQWEWSLTAAPFPQEGLLAPLTVLPAIAPDANSDHSSAPYVTGPYIRDALRWTAWAMLAAAGLLALVAVRRRTDDVVPAAGN